MFWPVAGSSILRRRLSIWRATHSLTVLMLVKRGIIIPDKNFYKPCSFENKVNHWKRLHMWMQFSSGFQDNQNGCKFLLKNMQTICGQSSLAFKFTSLTSVWKSQLSQEMINVICQSLLLNKLCLICINHTWQELFKPASSNPGEQLGIIA